LTDFSRRDAQIFLDWLTEGGTKRANGAAHRDKRMKGQSLKNYRSGLRSLFSELEDRELIDKNPWSKTKTIAVEEAVRRPMTEKERGVVFKALYSANPFLLLGVLFQYYCAIRPTEIRRLKFRNIDLEAGLVQLGPDVTKNHDRGAVTIPKEFISILDAFSIRTFPPDWWIFGRHLKPHPTIQMGEKTLSNAHRIILKNLEASGDLYSIEGLQFYSWKDNCGVSLVEGAVDIDDIRIHFRHKSLDYTQRYLSKKRGVIASIRDKESNLADVVAVKERLLNWNNKKFKI
jgi:integrase